MTPTDIQGVKRNPEKQMYMTDPKLINYPNAQFGSADTRENDSNVYVKLKLKACLQASMNRCITFPLLWQLGHHKHRVSDYPGQLFDVYY